MLRAQKRYCGLLLACVLSAIGGLLFNPYSDGMYGPRYLYETATCVIVLTSVCLMRLPAMGRAYMNIALPRPTLAGGLAVFVMCLFIAAIPYKITDMYKHYSHDYGLNTHDYATIMQTVKKPALVFMADADEFGHYYFTQPPYDTNPVIFAHDMGVSEKINSLWTGIPHGQPIWLPAKKLSRFIEAPLFSLNVLNCFIQCIEHKMVAYG